MNDINPDEIESVEVVKGPAAATLYGADASAGVIQIITKKGRRREQLHAVAAHSNGDSEPGLDAAADNYGSLHRGARRQLEHNPLCRGQAIGALVSDNPLERVAAFQHRQGSPDRLERPRRRPELRLQPVIRRRQGRRARCRTTSSSATTCARTSTTSPIRAHDRSRSLARADRADLPDNDNNIFGWLGGALLGSPPTRSDAAAAARTDGTASTVTTPRSIRAIIRCSRTA